MALVKRGKYALQWVSTLKGFICIVQGSDRNSKMRVVNERHQHLLREEEDRFNISSGLEVKYFLQGRSRFQHGDFHYFLYPNYQENLLSAGFRFISSPQFNFVLKDFIEALSHLHNTRRFHGQIAAYNLVICDGKGYLNAVSGRQPVLSGRTLGVNRRDDVLNLASSILQCGNQGQAMSKGLLYLLDFMLRFGTLDTLLDHGFFSNSVKRLSFIETANRAILYSGKRIQMEFTLDTTLGLGSETCDWTTRLTDISLLAILTYAQNTPHPYGNNAVDLIRFYRNTWVHYPNKGGTMAQRATWLERTLHPLCPGIVFKLHEALRIEKITI